MTAGTGTPVCVIGLGRMGAGMARRLLEHDVPVVVWDRSTGPASKLARFGATVAATPAAAAQGCELVLLSVANWAATTDVLYGPGGVLADGPIPGVLASTSTLAPHDVVTLAGGTAAVLDVGLQGNHQHAAQGQLRLYVGGHAEVLARVRPTFDLLAQEVRHIGPLGAGMRLKVVMNLLMGVQVQVMAEAVALGAGLGLDRETVLDAITSSGFAGPMMRFKAQRLRTGEYEEPDFRLWLMAKDLDLAQLSAGEAGIDLPLVRAAQRTHETALARGLGDLDCAAIAEAVLPSARADLGVAVGGGSR